MTSHTGNVVAKLCHGNFSNNHGKFMLLRNDYIIPQFIIYPFSKFTVFRNVFVTSDPNCQGGKSHMNYSRDCHNKFVPPRTLLPVSPYLRSSVDRYFEFSPRWKIFIIFLYFYAIFFYGFVTWPRFECSPRQGLNGKTRSVPLVL